MGIPVRVLYCGSARGTGVLHTEGGPTVYIDVKRLRLRSGIGQRELARRMGVTAKVGQKWDKGQQPHSSRLPKLAEVLGLPSIDDLYTRTEGAE